MPGRLKFLLARPAHIQWFAARPQDFAVRLEGVDAFSEVLSGAFKRFFGQPPARYRRDQKGTVRRVTFTTIPSPEP